MTAKQPQTAVRMKDVAELAGVSRMAASSVLMGTGNGTIRVSSQTRSAIERAADELGYRPNQAAQQLAGKKSGVIALVVKDFHNFLTQRILATLHSAAASRGLRLLTVECDSDLRSLERVMQDRQAGWVDAVIFLARNNEEQWDGVRELIGQRQDCVVIVGDLDIEGTHRVVSDVTTGAKESVEALAKSGRRNLTILTEERESISICHRLQAYAVAMAECGLPFHCDQVVVETKGWFLNDRATDRRFDALALRIHRDIGADALLCDSDFTAAGIMRAFRRMQIRVPQDIAVVGWGNLQFSGIYDPSLTTVADDLPVVLEQALEAVLGPESLLPVHRLVPTQLVRREST
ncbi:MAG: LacI family transcriptional regulator [bacterium]|nr:LacI family transcriptional regulator [bacterium]